MWWNGRHKGLKIPRRNNRAGSSPATGTKIGNLRQKVADFTYYFFTIHYSLKLGADFGEVIRNREA